MVGELAGLGCAPLWAIATILIKTQTDKLEVLQINAIRSIFAMAFALVIFPIFGSLDDIYSLSLSTIAFLFISIAIGMVLGDSLYFKGMGIIGVSRAMPMSIIYPVFVLPFSVILVGETLSIMNAAGIFIIIVGLYLIAAPQNRSEEQSKKARKQQWRGIFLVLAASLCWAAGTVILKFAMTKLDPIMAGAIRMPFTTLALFLIIYLRKGTAKVWNHGFRSLAILGLAGILGIGLGGLLFMTGVKYTGPAKTAILSSTAPLFGAPLSMFMLREKLTLKIVLGTILCVAGIWFVV